MIANDSFAPNFENFIYPIQSNPNNFIALAIGHDKSESKINTSKRGVVPQIIISI